MKRFEVGSIYTSDCMAYEVVKRTEKTVTFVEIQHYGKQNERRMEPKIKKIFIWDGSIESFEVAYPTDSRIIMA